MLLGKKDLFAKCLAEKMLTYALGRGLEYYDRRAVDAIAAALAKNDYKFSALVAEIVKSDPFRMRRGKERTASGAASARRLFDSRRTGGLTPRARIPTRSLPMTRTISRRTVLKGLGVSLALPWLEAMGPVTAVGRRPKPSAPRPRTAWRSCTCPTARTWPTGRRRPKGRTSSCPPILEAARSRCSERLARADRADRRQGPGPRRRRRRPRPRARRVPHRLRSRARPTAPTSAPASRSIRWPRRGSATRRGCRRWRSAARHGAMAGNCDSRLLAASTRRRCRGGRRRSRCRRK